MIDECELEIYDMRAKSIETLLYIEYKGNTGSK